MNAKVLYIPSLAFAYQRVRQAYLKAESVYLHFPLSLVRRSHRILFSDENWNDVKGNAFSVPSDLWDQAQREHHVILTYFLDHPERFRLEIPSLGKYCEKHICELKQVMLHYFFDEVRWIDLHMVYHPSITLLERCFSHPYCYPEEGVVYTFPRDFFRRRMHILKSWENLDLDQIPSTFVSYARAHDRMLILLYPDGEMQVVDVFLSKVKKMRFSERLEFCRLLREAGYQDSVGGSPSLFFLFFTGHLFFLVYNSSCSNKEYWIQVETVSLNL